MPTNANAIVELPPDAATADDHRNPRRLRSIDLREQLERVWQISKIQPQQGRCILNFYGPPGTGKTRAALGVALRLGKPLYQVDYSWSD